MDKQSATARERRHQMARMAISELFLDSNLDEAVFGRLHGQLLESGLTIEELDQIYYDELAPLLHRNLTSPAGKWSGFDANWLEMEIERRSRWPTWASIPGLGKLLRYWVTRTTEGDWRKLRLMLQKRRSLSQNAVIPDRGENVQPETKSP